MVPVGADGKIGVYDQAGSQVVVDVFGYFVAASSARGGRFTSVFPGRILDTRAGGATVDGRFAGIGQVAADAEVSVTVAGRAGVPVSGVSAVVLNVTATQAVGPGFVQVLPGGSGAPWAWSNLNLDRAGQTMAGLAIVPVDASGNVRFYSQSGTHLVADVFGWFTDGTAPVSTVGLYTPILPIRLADTRLTGGPIPPYGVLAVAPAANPVLASANPGALVLNLTATGALGPGFFSVFPTGGPGGLSSNLNVERAGQTIANAVVTPTGDGGQFSVLTQSGSPIVVDASGWFSGAPSVTSPSVELLSVKFLTTGIGCQIDVLVRVTGGAATGSFHVWNAFYGPAGDIYPPTTLQVGTGWASSFSVRNLLTLGGNQPKYYHHEVWFQYGSRQSNHLTGLVCPGVST